MSFTNDEKWNNAKKIAKQEGKGTDWCYIVTLYNYMDGNQIGVYVTFPNESNKYRVLGVTDRDTTLIEEHSSKDTYREINSEEAFRLKKVFETHNFETEYSEDLKGTTMLGQSKLKYYIESVV